MLLDILRHYIVPTKHLFAMPSCLGVPALLYTLILLSNVGSCIKLYPKPATLPAAVPAPCKAVMSADIACGPYFIKPGDIRYEVPFNNTLLSAYCNSTCTSSMKSYVDNVNARCGTTAYQFGTNNTKKTASEQIAPLKWARDVACLTGSSQTDFCLPKVLNHTVGYCDDCTLKYFSGLLGSDQGTGRMDEQSFTSLLVSSCKVAPSKYPHSTVSTSSRPPMYVNPTLNYGID
jgi:hypothetical protein